MGSLTPQSQTLGCHWHRRVRLRKWWLTPCSQNLLNIWYEYCCEIATICENGLQEPRQFNFYETNLGVNVPWHCPFYENKKLWWILRSLLSSKNIREIINYKKTQTHQFIQILLKMNKLEQVGGHRNSGFLYKLK